METIQTVDDPAKLVNHYKILVAQISAERDSLKKQLADEKLAHVATRQDAEKFKKTINAVAIAVMPSVAVLASMRADQLEAQAKAARERADALATTKATG